MMRSYFRIMTNAGLIAITCSFTATASWCDAQSISAFGSGLLGAMDQDQWAVYTNPSGLAECGQSGIGISQINRYSVPDWNDAAVTITYRPSESVCIGSGVGKSGFPGFGSLRIPVSAGIRLNNRCAIGIRGEANDLRVKESHDFQIAAAAGSVFDISSTVRIGVWIENIQRLLTVRTNGIRPPVTFITGVTLQTTSHLKGIIEVEAALSGACLRIGTEYKPAKELACRLGYVTAQRSFAIGIGYQFGKTNCDIALQQHPFLGFSGGIGLRKRLG